MTRETKPISERVISALILIQFLFGMNYVFSKVILEYLPPLLWASIRVIITALILVVFSTSIGKMHLPKNPRQYVQLIVFGFLSVAFNQGTFLLGLHYTNPTNSALLNTLIPVFTILIVTLRGQEAVSMPRTLGFICAFIGVLVLHQVENFSFSNKTFLGDLLILVNTVSYSLFLAYSHRFFEKNDFIWATTWLFIFGGVILTAWAIPDWMAFHWLPMSPAFWICACVTIIGGTVLPYLLISFTLKYTQSSLVALFIYIQPLIAAVTSYLFFGQKLSERALVSGVLIFTGLFLAVSQHPFRTRLSKSVDKSKEYEKSEQEERKVASRR